MIFQVEIIQQKLRQVARAARWAAPRILILAIRLYQKFVSPLTGCNCRYHPTCSCYAREAIETHGVACGVLLASLRILRCNPFSSGGIDPVPDTFTLFTKNQPNGR